MAFFDALLFVDSDQEHATKWREQQYRTFTTHIPSPFSLQVDRTKIRHTCTYSTHLAALGENILVRPSYWYTERGRAGFLALCLTLLYPLCFDFVCCFLAPRTRHTTSSVHTRYLIDTGARLPRLEHRASRSRKIHHFDLIYCILRSLALYFHLFSRSESVIRGIRYDTTRHVYIDVFG